MREGIWSKTALIILIMAAGLTGCTSVAGALESKLQDKPTTERLAVLREECRAAARLDRGPSTLRQSRQAALRARCAELESAIERIEAGRRDGTAVAFQRSYAACLDESKRDGAMFNYRWHEDRRPYYWHAKAVCDAYDTLFGEVTRTRPRQEPVHQQM